ncbi:PREDICTED: protein WUSCHEL-like [Ipomoea nil]|uniref:protein WUSCHEL-like n=1 Tax=Ipomoea nil TaxID=35883 RepID=UPI000900E01D|nr:PREDICTED: protein WUSCHEL-like [Ipomoea nil]
MDAEGQQCIGQKVQQGGEENNKCSSRRWKPTVEQLEMLEELYYKQRMMRPSTEEIERLSLRLRQLGKIEAKNVFYWFQNQRNRERHPRKRPAIISPAPPAGDLLHNNYNNAAPKRSKPPQTLSLFPMHGHADSVSLELTLRPYSPE